MINVVNTYSQLKTCIVGIELDIPTRYVDETFRYFYQENLNRGLYEVYARKCGFTEYHINKEILDIRREQLDGLAKTLSDLNVKVYRPKRIKPSKIKTNNFDSYSSIANNVRDLTFVYKNYIIETPVFIRNRIFENEQLYDIFKTEVGDDIWIKIPNSDLTENSIDLFNYKLYRDFSNIPIRFQAAIDGAQFLPIDEHNVIVNVTTYNHYLGLQRIKSLFKDTEFHIINQFDNHLDGSFTVLKEGVFLVGSKHIKLFDNLSDKFKNWKIIVIDTSEIKDIDMSGFSDKEIKLASSAGMDLNVLSLNENTVLVNKRANVVIKKLEKNGFDVIPIQLDYGELFGGGIHCSTLDLLRQN